MNCKICRADLSADAKFCHQCGATQAYPLPRPSLKSGLQKYGPVSLAGGSEDWSCPKCGSDNTISVPLAYGSGTSKTESLSLYVGTKDNYGLIPTIGTSQTAVAKLLSPPVRKVPGTALGAGAAVGIAVGVLALVFGLFGLFFTTTIEGLLTMMFGGVIAVYSWKKTTRETQEYNENVWRPAREEWEKKFLCQRCGVVFLPADSVAASGQGRSRFRTRGVDCPPPR